MLYSVPWSSRTLLSIHSALLLMEFGNDSEDVLEDIGQVRHEILWQIAHFEDIDMEGDDASSFDESQRIRIER